MKITIERCWQGVGLRLSVAGGLLFPIVAALERGGSAELCGRIRHVLSLLAALHFLVAVHRTSSPSFSVLMPALFWLPSRPGDFLTGIEGRSTEAQSLLEVRQRIVGPRYPARYALHRASLPSFPAFTTGAMC